jgi:hypothetical protein
MSQRRQSPRKAKGTSHKIKPLAELKIIHPHAAGLDIDRARPGRVCPRRAAPSRCAPSGRSRLICTRWPIG